MNNVFVRQLRNGIPRVYIYFCSTERNSELFSLSQKGSEHNSKSLLQFELFSLPRMVQNGISRVCFYFCSMIQNSEHFSPLQTGSKGIPRGFCSVYSVIRGIIFCRKLTTLLQLRGGPSIPIIIPLLFCLSV
jgi:hypothetical protein